MAGETNREVLGLKPKGDLIREAEERPLQGSPDPALLAMTPTGQLAPGQVEGGRVGESGLRVGCGRGQEQPLSGVKLKEGICPDPDLHLHNPPKGS